MELNTYGDLKKAIQAIAKQQRNEKVGNTTVDIITGLIPYAGVAKNTLGVIKAFFGKPDTVKTKTWLDKIDVDDEFSAIVDDTVENAFLKITANIIDNEPDTKPLEDNFNMNQRLVDYLKEKFEGRTVTGIQESNTYNKNKKMKNEALKKLIKEEIKNLLKEDQPVTTGSALAKGLRQTSMDLTKDTGGFSSMEASGVDVIIKKLLDKAKEGNLSLMVMKQINVILDRVK